MTPTTREKDIVILSLCHLNNSCYNPHIDGFVQASSDVRSRVLSVGSVILYWSGVLTAPTPVRHQVYYTCQPFPSRSYLKATFGQKFYKPRDTIWERWISKWSMGLCERSPVVERVAPDTLLCFGSMCH